MRDGNMMAAQAGQEARETARKHSPWLVAFGRFGHAAKGVVYILIGVLAVQVALGRGGETTDSQGALARIAGAPFGKFLLIAAAAGIAGYALWRLLQAALDTDGVGTDGEGIIKRLGYAGSAIIHASLALSAVRLLQTGRAGESSSSSTQSWTAQLLERPFGQALVGLAGLVVIGVGGYQLYKGVKAKFREELNLGQMSATEDRWATRLGQVGYCARGVVFGLIGVFLIVAAAQSNPGEARGVDGALAALAEQSFGPWLLGVVAAGFVSYGLYMFAEARYRRMVV
jgi:hypothetical protein